MNALQVTLSTEQEDRLADKIADRLAARMNRSKSLTVSEAAAALNVSYNTVDRRIAAGTIRLVPNIGARRITQSEIDRILEGREQ